MFAKALQYLCSPVSIKVIDSSVYLTFRNASKIPLAEECLSRS